MVSGNQKKGKRYELVALTYLMQAGLTPIATNVTNRYGEIDLIMNDQQTIVFIEVRFRQSAQFGSAVISVTPRKQHRLYLAAGLWLAQRQASFDTTDCRFDIFAITGNQVEWITNAFNNNLDNLF